MKLTAQSLKKIIREELNKITEMYEDGTDEFYGKIPEDLWDASDYEDLKDLGEERLMSFTKEELNIKIQQLKSEIEYENTANPDSDYGAIASKESAIHHIENELIPNAR